MNAYHADEVGLLTAAQLAGATLWASETTHNLDEGYMFGESGPYETYALANQRGRLFRSLQKEYGRCTGRIYRTIAGIAYPVGWCFEKTSRYDDTGRPFRQETWVNVYVVPE